MKKSIVIAEKPSVAREIARVLGCNKKSNGALCSDKYVVTWALGHLVTLAQPEKYGEKYKKWDMIDLPMIPNKMELEVIKQTSKQYGIVKSLMRSSEVDTIIIATDAGREGELVARWIIEKAGVKKPIKRLWISSQTDKAIKDGFKNLKDGSKYYNLYRAAECRAEADWLVGLNITRALTCKHGAQLSAGRVQTPTLNMIVEKENQIKKFVPVDYFTVQAKVNNISLNWQGKDGQVRIFDKNRLDELIKRISNQKGKVGKVKKENKKTKSPQAYDLTDLQIDANSKLNFGAKKTLSVLQKLYEYHKIVTYPRTDSKYITQDIVPTLKERIKCISVGPYKTYAAALLKTNLNITNRFVDNKKVGDHHALIPTEQFVDLSALSKDERMLYDLIVKRFIAVLSPDYEYEQTKVEITIANEVFETSCKIVKNKGWKSVYDEKESNVVVLNFKENDLIKIDKIESKKEQTNPPKRYTEGTLLADMENPKKFVESIQMKKTLSEVGGIGTVATRADIIEKLFNTFYIDKKGKELYPTSKGKQLVEIVPADFKSPLLTGVWEQKLVKISEGKIKDKDFINEIRQYSKDMVNIIKNDTVKYKHDNMTSSKCPECNSNLLSVKKKDSESLVCSNVACKYRQVLSRVSNARCPQCHKKMGIAGEGEGKIFVCKTCGFREKLSTWNKKKESQKNNMDKKQVNNYMKKLKKENSEFESNPLADALKNLKF